MKEKERLSQDFKMLMDIYQRVQITDSDDLKKKLAALKGQISQIEGKLDVPLSHIQGDGGP